MAKRKYKVLARTRKNNKVRRVYRLLDGDRDKQFTRNKSDKTKGLFTKAEAKEAIKWADKKGAAGFATTQRWPFLVLDTDTAWGNPKLGSKLDQLAEQLQRYGWCGEFKRPAKRQWYFYQGWLARKPGFNLAAPCCHKNYLHSWNACGQTPRSNHAPGNACDFSILHSGRGGSFTNVGEWNGARAKMRKLGLCLPVPGEKWHVELGNNWRS